MEICDLIFMRQEQKLMLIATLIILDKELISDVQVTLHRDKFL